MSNEEAIQLLKQAVTLLQCDFDARCKLIEAVKTVEVRLVSHQELPPPKTE